MNKIICKNLEEMSLVAAAAVAAQIWQKPASALGLATGQTPFGLYMNLAKMSAAGDLSFANTVAFNLNEYYPLKRDNTQSHAYYLWKNLFAHVDIAKENIHLLDGEAPEAVRECAYYDGLVDEVGGLDLQILTLRENGHISLGEPHDFLRLSTHVTPLSPEAVEANTRVFVNEADMPRHALTLGLKAIFGAKHILLLAAGESRAQAVKRLFTDCVSMQTPASLLALHPRVTVVLDRAAAKYLS
ncbi:MAG: glucosamine-6-phosphate deaminase [Lachnospiraceae bacterium]|jgi:glucosamine-6-phosphate deaminase|nr:glucosamine-6-phosphate deaminase [Lachnospiraceae bacterium]